MGLEFCNFNFAARIGAARSVRLLPDAANSGTAESLVFAKQKAALILKIFLLSAQDFRTLVPGRGQILVRQGLFDRFLNMRLRDMRGLRRFLARILRLF